MKDIKCMSVYVSFCGQTPCRRTLSICRPRNIMLFSVKIRRKRLTCGAFVRVVELADNPTAIKQAREARTIDVRPLSLGLT